MLERLRGAWLPTTVDKRDPWASFGGLLCAKEACIKLMSAFDDPPRHSFLELEIRHATNGRPFLVDDPVSPTTRHEFERARALCEELGDMTRLFEAMWGLWYSQFNAADPRGTRESARELLTMAEGAPPLLCLAHEAAGATTLASGEHARALNHLEASLANRAAAPVGALARARDPVVLTHCFRAWSNMDLGFVDTAVDDVGSSRSDR